MSLHILRYDDFSAYSCTQVEALLVELFLKHRIPCTFAVVPFACDPEALLTAGSVTLRPLPKEKAALLAPLLKDNLAEVALHGFSHLTLAPLRGHEEFSERMPRQVQANLLRRGRDHLQNVFQRKVVTYVPPWNRLAASTAQVLREEGFLLSSDTPHEFGSRPQLDQFPCATGIQATDRALSTMRWFQNPRNGVGTLLHDYDFLESSFGTSQFSIPSLDTLLGRWRQFHSIRYKLLSEVILEDAGRSPERIHANGALRNSLYRGRLLRKRFSRLADVYWDTEVAHRLEAFVRRVP